MDKVIKPEHKELLFNSINKLQYFDGHYDTAKSSISIALAEYHLNTFIITDGTTILGKTLRGDISIIYLLGEGVMRPFEFDRRIRTRNLDILWKIKTYYYSPDMTTKYESNLKLNPDIYKHIITKEDFKQFIRRDKILRLVN